MNNSTEMALPVFMFAGGAIGNLIAILVLSVSRQEKKSSAFFSLVRGLAVTDLLGTCLASPFTIANYLDQHVLRSRHFCEFDSFLLLFFGLTGLSIICAMAAERYLAICCPYRYQRWGVDRGFAQKLLFLIYISHILFCCLPMMGISRSELQPPGTWCFIDWKTPEPVAAAYSVLYGAVSLLLILGTIVLNLTVCGALLLMRRRTVQRPVARASVRQRWKALSSAAETQMMAVLVMTSVVVLACSAPLVVRIFANRFRSDQKADLAAIRIASLNPILDPWIYILLRRSLFRRLLSRHGVVEDDEEKQCGGSSLEVHLPLRGHDPVKQPVDPPDPGRGSEGRRALVELYLLDENRNILHISKSLLCSCRCFPLCSTLSCQTVNIPLS
uniref:G-protein coupled receptors family 1 profile domain-containing protein n=1 Tax=Fundulus heteroclitus TaxID=8078 RepID=A0A3Q2U944_FUNHE